MLPSEYVRLGWVQGYAAIDEDGAEFEYGDEPGAIAWCLTGACNAACLAPQPDPPQLREIRISRIADVMEAILEERQQLPLPLLRQTGTFERPAAGTTCRNACKRKSLNCLKKRSGVWDSDSRPKGNGSLPYSHNLIPENDD